MLHCGAQLVIRHTVTLYHSVKLMLKETGQTTLKEGKERYSMSDSIPVHDGFIDEFSFRDLCFEADK